MEVVNKIINNHLKGTRGRYLLENGLYLEISTKGIVSWVTRKQINGKRETTIVGNYPAMSLEDAQETIRINRTITSPTILPETIEEQKEQQEPKEQKENNHPDTVKEKGPVPTVSDIKTNASIKDPTFEDIYKEYLKKELEALKTKVAIRAIESRARDYILPELGRQEVRSINSQEILRIVRKVAETGKFETSRRVLSLTSSVFKHARHLGFCDVNPAAELSEELVTAPKTPVSSLSDPSDIGRLLYAINGYSSFYLRHAMRIQAHTFVRSTELRSAEWNEIDLDKKTWIISALKVNKPSAHLIPLSRQVAAVFKTLYKITGGSQYVFRSTKNPHIDAYFSEGAVLVALKSCLSDADISEGSMVGQGWKVLAEKILRGKFPHEVVNKQLGYVPHNRLRDGRSEYPDNIPERTAMMQWYSDYLDSLEEEEKKKSIAAKDSLYWKLVYRNIQMT